MKQLNLIILVDDRAFAEDLRRYFSVRSEYNLCGVTEDGKKGLALVEQFRPEILIVSAHLMSMDGFTVMNETKNRGLAARVIALCDKGNDKDVNRVYSYNVDYCFTTPVTAEKVGELVAEFATALSFRKRKSKDEFLDGRITGILVQIGIRQKLNGFGYLRSAIRLSVNYPEMRRKITGALYPAIGLEFKTNKDKVERGIRTAIDSAWVSGQMSVLNDLLGYDCIGDRRPTNGELISMIADKLSQEIKRYA